MADLTELQSAQSVKLVGSSSGGAESAFVQVSSTQDVRSADCLHSGGLEGSLSVSTSAVELKVGGSKLANRKLVTAIPDGTIYWGYTSGVTTSTGTQIYKDQYVIWSADDTCTIYLITASGTKNVRITESP
jgi:hypothetical protein